MGPVGWISVAVATALAVIAVAGAVSGAGDDGSGLGARQFLRDLRAGLRHARDEHAPELPPETLEELDDLAFEEGTVADLFFMGEAPETDYVDATELSQPIATVARRTVGRVITTVRIAPPLRRSA